MRNSPLVRNFLKFFVHVVAIVAIIVAGYFYNQTRLLKADPAKIAQQEVEDLVEKVGKIFILPQGEVPTVFTVSDPEALKTQAFSVQAEKGDKVLIYNQAKKAIFYSVSSNRVIDSSPFDIDTQNTATVPASAPVTPSTAPNTPTKP